MKREKTRVLKHLAFCKVSRVLQWLIARFSDR